jgi:hypothetical protein
MFARLVRQLDSEILADQYGTDYDVLVIDDASDTDYVAAVEGRPGWTVWRNDDDNGGSGKANYWKTWAAVAVYVACSGADRWLAIPDDVELVGGLFRSLERFAVIAAGYGRRLDWVINPLVDTRQSGNWGSGPPAPYGFSWAPYAADLNSVGWWDCCHYAPAAFAAIVAGALQEAPPVGGVERSGTSSGVGRQVTLAARRAGWLMLQARRSLVTHGAHESKMNPDRLTPLATPI